MFDNAFGLSVGRLMTPNIHKWFSRLTGWMFAAVWLRSEKRHKWMWVNERLYYSGELQSV